MKHWSEFLTNRTHFTKRLSKIANTLTYEVQETEMKVINAKANLERLELQICNKLADNYNNEIDYEKAVLTAKTKAAKWNNEPIKDHKPHTVKK